VARMSLVAVAGLAAALSLVASCSTLAEMVASGDPVESRPYDLPREVVWEESLRGVKESYRLARSNAADGTFESEWKTNLSPFGGLGFRRRVEGEIVEREGAYVVSLRVRVEKNSNPDAPLDARRAEWERADDDTTEAALVLRRIDSVLGRLERGVPR